MATAGVSALVGTGVAWSIYSSALNSRALP